GLLTAYTSMIGQADARFRQAGGQTIGTADLWNASHLLHNPKGGVLDQLDKLSDMQKEVLVGQLQAVSAALGTTLTLLASIVGLFVLLLTSQLIMRRRFRRTVNLWLALATVLLLVLSAVSSDSIVSRQHLEHARTTLSDLVADSRVQADQTAAK